MTRLRPWVLAALALLLLAGFVARAGLTRRWVEDLGLAETQRRTQLRVWDWWSASSNEEYGHYFEALEREFEAQHRDIDVVYQTVPFGNYVQKLSTAMVGDTPPDVFQSSVYWAEGFYHRGMLRPLNDLLDASPALPGTPSYIGESAFLPSAWRHNHTEGPGDERVVYGIPQIIDASCLLGTSTSCRRRQPTTTTSAASSSVATTAASTGRASAGTPCATGSTSAT
jgi:ABC-type glycerol-3-phosphate transport system substrate-binding protein